MRIELVLFRAMISIATSLFINESVHASSSSDSENKETKSYPSSIVMSPYEAGTLNPSQDTNAQLEFIYAGIPNDIYSIKSQKTSDILDECFPSTRSSKAGALISPLLGYLAPKLVGLFIKEVDKGLEKEIKKYSNTHSKSKAILPYSKDPNLSFRSPCFRYTRFAEIKQMNEETNAVTSSRTIEFDFIGQWRVADKQFIQLRPLRVYMKNPSVPNDASIVSLAISAKANGVWRETNQGHADEIFHTVVLKEKIKKPNVLKAKTVSPQDINMGWTKGLHHYDLDDTKSWDKIEALPIIPYSKGRTPDTALSKIEISVAEVGDGKRKKTLKFLRKSLEFFKDDLTSVLEEAAKGIFEEEVPEVDDTKHYCATFTSSLNQETGGVVGQVEWNDSGEKCPVSTSQ